MNLNKKGGDIMNGVLLKLAKEMLFVHSPLQVTPVSSENRTDNHGFEDVRRYLRSKSDSVCKNTVNPKAFLPH